MLDSSAYDATPLPGEAAAVAAAFEHARLAAEEEALHDEEEWSREEQRLLEEEDSRREARAARREDEEACEAAHDAGAFEEPEGQSAFVSLLELEGNCHCFDCDGHLHVDALGEAGGHGLEEAAGLWWSVSHGTLLCAACAAAHRDELEPQVSRVRPADGSATSAAMLPELDALFAGGNCAFTEFLASEQIGVARHVWLALPLGARYHTPAADLYRRRLHALIIGEAELPADLRRVIVPPPREALQRDAAALRERSRPDSSPSRLQTPWSPPRDALQDHDAASTNTDFLTSIADMRRRIEAARKHQPVVFDTARQQSDTDTD
jgi:hypothetical protein